MSELAATEQARVLVTGAGGFVGGRLIHALRLAHPEWRLSTPAAPTKDGRPGELDVTNAEAVSRCIREQRPDIVVHLAAVAAVPSSIKDPRLAWRVNLDGTLNILLAVEAHAADAHVLFVSSAEVYGASLNGGAAANEACLLQPVNAYAASKAAADILVRQAAASGLSATVVRPFNHTGPGQSEAFVAPSFAGQIARIEAGQHPPVLEVGSLDDERDFLDVDDVVDAYVALLDARATLAAGDVFNVASGRALRIGDLLEHLLLRSRVRIKVTQKPQRLRPTAVRRVVGDASRLRERFGWKPRIPLDETLDRLLEWKRDEAAQKIAVAPAAVNPL